MSDDQQNSIALPLFPPISLGWDHERQELYILGSIFAGQEELPFDVVLHGEAATQTLRAFRQLLEQVDEEALDAGSTSRLQ